MGGNIARRLIKNGHEVAVFDRDREVSRTLAGEGAIEVDSLGKLPKILAGPRAVWLMLPAGKPTEETVAMLGEQLDHGDVIIDGGNTFYKDDIRRARQLESRGIHYLDVGTSGGIWGLERGYCMMIGGERKIVERLDPIFRALAPGHGSLERTRGRTSASDSAELGYLHVGRVGAGHFVKMIHNGIEYGLMQAYAEGFDILRNKASPDLPDEERYDLNLADIAEVWRRGSVISSWLLDLTALALAGDPELEKYSPAIADSGEGRWTIDAAVEQGVAAPVLATALFSRFRSRAGNSYADRLVSALRFGFGGHAERSD